MALARPNANAATEAAGYADRQAETDWQRAHRADPELTRIQRAGAVAARYLARLHESDPAYSSWLREYQKQGDLLADLYRRRRATGAAAPATIETDPIPDHYPPPLDDDWQPLEDYP